MFVFTMNLFIWYGASRRGIATTGFRMSKIETKQVIVDTFRENVKTSSYSKIRVASLIEECGISRTAFYYHFTNKLAITLYIFFYDLSGYLKDVLPESKLVFGPEESDKNFAYYTHNEAGAHALDGSDFFKALCLTVCKDSSFYKGLIAEGNREFLNELCRTYHKKAEEDVLFILGGRRLSGAEKNYLTAMITRAITGTVEYAINNPTDIRELTEFNNSTLWNNTHDSIRSIIENRLARHNTRPSF